MLTIVEGVETGLWDLRDQLDLLELQVPRKGLQAPQVPKELQEQRVQPELEEPQVPLALEERQVPQERQALRALQVLQELRVVKVLQEQQERGQREPQGRQEPWVQ